MIARLLVVGATLLTLIAGLSLTAWLELDRSAGQPVFVPVGVSELDQADGIRVYAVGPFLDLRLDHDPGETTWLHLELDERGIVAGVEQHDEAPADATPALRVRSYSYLPARTRLEAEHHDRVEYALYRLTPSGDVYLVALADAELNLLGRGDRAW